MLYGFFLSWSCLGYTQGFRNLKQYVLQDSLSDYGFGLEKTTIVEDTGVHIFSLNSFLDSNILFRKITGDSIRVVVNGDDVEAKVSYKNEMLDQFYVYKNGKLLAKHKYPNGLFFESAGYLMMYRGSTWFVMYSTPKFLGSTTLIQNEGVMVNLNTFQVYNLPDWQSTNSLLCFTDYNLDGTLDYVQFKGGIDKDVKFFQIGKDSFIPDKKFLLKMSVCDSRTYFLDSLNSKIPPVYHDVF